MMKKLEQSKQNDYRCDHQNGMSVKIILLHPF